MIECIVGGVLLVAIALLVGYASRLSQTARGGRNYRFPVVSYDARPMQGAQSKSVRQNLR